MEECPAQKNPFRISNLSQVFNVSSVEKDDIYGEIMLF